VSQKRSQSTLILGQGLAGSVLAWQLHWQSEAVILVNSPRIPRASAVAAGLMMPVSGKKFTLHPDFSSRLQQAESFYRRVENSLGTNICRKISIFRRFLTQGERDFFLGERYESVKELVQLVPGTDSGPTGFLMQGARLNVPVFLKRTEQFFREHHCYVDSDVNPETDVVVGERQVEIRPLNLTADRIVFCQGAAGQGNPWFPGVPDQPLRGEILTIQRTSGLEYDVSLGEFWLTPVHANEDIQDELSAGNRFLLGATYDRTNVTAGTTDAGRDELLSALPGLVDGPWEVLEHRSGIRAGTRRREVVAGFHSKHRHVGIVNGLGSYGSLLAPMAVQKLLNEPATRTSSSTNSSVNRGRGAEALTSKAHTIVRRAVVFGDYLLDATAGNGHDTEFLSGLTDASRVTAIDIQQTAIEKTRERLKSAGRSGVNLLCGDHADEIAGILRERSDLAGVFGAVMFNLGYLPGSDRIRTTQTKSTVLAMAAAVRLLRSGGVMTVLAYRGHPGGAEEAHAAREVADQFPECQVDVIDGDHAEPTSPVLIVVRKLTSTEGNALKTTSQR
jgi:glycine/D-amino acid oxidase-like deaminating enzyme